MRKGAARLPASSLIPLILPMKATLVLVLTLLSCVLYGVLNSKKSPSPGVAGTRPAAASQVAQSQQELAGHLAQQKDAQREAHVDLDAQLAAGAARVSDELRDQTSRETLATTREARNQLLHTWNLTDAQIARVEQVQLDHWRMQLQDTDRAFLERPGQLGDRTDPKRVEAFDAKAQSSAGAAKQVFRLELLAVLGSPDRVEEYLRHEDAMLEITAKDLQRRLDAAAGKPAARAND